MGAVGPLFGLSRIQSVRAGLLLAAGGEFAFVALCAPAPCHNEPTQSLSVLLCCHILTFSILLLPLSLSEWARGSVSDGCMG